jgi:hypothetical protein
MSTDQAPYLSELFYETLPERDQGIGLRAVRRGVYDKRPRLTRSAGLRGVPRHQIQDAVVFTSLSARHPLRPLARYRVLPPGRAQHLVTRSVQEHVPSPARLLRAVGGVLEDRQALGRADWASPSRGERASDYPRRWLSLGTNRRSRGCSLTRARLHRGVRKPGPARSTRSWLVPSSDVATAV